MLCMRARENTGCSKLLTSKCGRYPGRYANHRLCDGCDVALIGLCSKVIPRHRVYYVINKIDITNVQYVDMPKPRYTQPQTLNQDINNHDRAQRHHKTERNHKQI
jgi:hypothetical protein